MKMRRYCPMCGHASPVPAFGRAAHMCWRCRLAYWLNEAAEKVRRPTRLVYVVEELPRESELN